MITVNQIGEGRYRKVYSDGNKALKILRPKIKKNYWLLQIEFPTKTYTKFKFGIDDFNRFEYETYLQIIEKIPQNLRNSFYEIYGVLGNTHLSELVRDYDGKVSETISKKQRVGNIYFWNRINDLESLLIDKEILLMDIRGENILVREIEENKKIPVIVDYKRYGSRTYPFQFLTKKRMVEKIRRRFKKIKEDHHIA
jgi:hypothetical protein